ncbi:sigma factor, partial [Lactococcus garvieae]|uniref:sigma factor n=1 Tax=Lactococcus garvieae TaxID=1363 RepID=UPI0023EE4DEB
MSEPDDAAATFAAERPRLVGLAYRMLGTPDDADDVVQDAWFRWEAADRSAIREPAAWLTTVTTRLAIDRLRSARARREVYVGPW